MNQLLAGKADRMIFKNDTYIPLDAVIKKTGTDVFVNVPKRVAGKMPWNAPPTNESDKEKQGQAATEVDKLYQSFAPALFTTYFKYRF